MSQQDNLGEEKSKTAPCIKRKWLKTWPWFSFSEAASELGSDSNGKSLKSLWNGQMPPGRLTCVSKMLYWERFWLNVVTGFGCWKLLSYMPRQQSALVWPLKVKKNPSRLEGAGLWSPFTVTAHHHVLESTATPCSCYKTTWEKKPLEKMWPLPLSEGQLMDCERWERLVAMHKGLKSRQNILKASVKFIVWIKRCITISKYFYRK